MPTPTQSYREIPLTQGQVALVDAQDYKRVSKLKWWLHKNSRGYAYARAYTGTKNGKRIFVLLHRFLIPGFKIVDHQNGNGLDCRRSNIRGCPTTGHNVANQKSTRNKTGYKGVSVRGRRFVAMISEENGNRYLGIRKTAEDAARLYDAAARAKWGEFAQVNFS